RTVAVAEPGDRRGRDLDLAARGRQGRRVGVAPKLADYPTVPGQGWQCEFAGLPERVEVGRLGPALQQSAASRFIEMPQPLPRRTALGELVGNTEPLGQGG